MNKRHLTKITLLNTYSHRIYPPSKFIESSKTGHDRSPTKILSLVSSLTKKKKNKKISPNSIICFMPILEEKKLESLGNESWILWRGHERNYIFVSIRGIWRDGSRRGLGNFVFPRFSGSVGWGGGFVPTLFATPLYEGKRRRVCVKIASGHAHRGYDSRIMRNFYVNTSKRVYVHAKWEWKVWEPCTGFCTVFLATRK